MVATVVQNLRAEVRGLGVNVALSALSLGETKRARMQDGSAVFCCISLALRVLLLFF